MQELSLESIVKSDEDILIAALLEAENPVDWFVREGMPVPNEPTWREMILKVQIITSMVKTTKGYLGDFEYMCVSHKFGDVYLFPAGIQKVLCVVTKSGRRSNLVERIRQHTTKLE